LKENSENTDTEELLPRVGRGLNGTKLCKKYYENSLLMQTTDYSGNFVYKDKQTNYILFSEGRLIRVQDSSF
jgi:hypothetical protein